MLSSVKKFIPESIKAPLRTFIRKYREKRRKHQEKRILRAAFNQAIEKKNMQTSISDNGYYPLICYLASKHESVFMNFRRNPVYMQIVGTSVTLGYNCFSMLMKNQKFKPAPEDWKNFQK